MATQNIPCSKSSFLRLDGSQIWKQPLQANTTENFFFIFRLTTVGCHPVCLAGVQQAGAGPGLLELQLPEVEEEERKQQQGTYEQVA